MVAFRLFDTIPVYFFSVLLAVGTILGLVWVVLRAQPPQTAILSMEAGLWGLAGGLIGGRAGYVGLAWAYYRDQAGDIFQVYLGGLTWWGALGGSILAVIIFAVLKKEPLARLADTLTPLATAVAVAVWLGCLVDGCGYGPPVEWGGIASPDEWGQTAPRWPVQLFASLLILGIFWFLDWRIPITRPGLHAALLLLGLAAVQFGAAMIAIQSAFWHGWPIDAWAALILGGAAMFGVGLAARSGSPYPFDKDNP